MFDTNIQIEHPDMRFEVAEDAPRGIVVDKVHEDLLKYLTSRLDLANSLRANRLRRYARIDRAVSTWQKLDPEDQKRAEKEETDGTPQAIKAVIPILHTHVEDTVAFFAGVFSPNSKDFFQLSKPTLAPAMTKLVDKMNADAQSGSYYFQLSAALRSIIKYNIAGFGIDWWTPLEGIRGSEPGNRIRSLDMYNFVWDASVKNPAKIATDAEYVAEFDIVNRYQLVRNARQEGWHRMDKVIHNDDEYYKQSNSKAKESKYYKYPPSEAGIALEDSPSDQSRLTAYFTSIDTGESPKIFGHEICRMICRLNPTEFDLISDEEKDANPAYRDGVYELWCFTIIDSNQIVYAKRLDTYNDQIPSYLGHLNVDDTGEAAKSIAELMKAFQSFVSFLFNTHVAGVRGNIWGWLGVNPKIYDVSKIRKGDVAGILEMRQEAAQAGHDAKTGIARIQGNGSETKQTMQDVATVMNLLQSMFPSQGLPAQMAGIDRAIESQVAAVLQGVSRRLHMLAHAMDNQIMNPLRMAAYYNIAKNVQGELKSSITALGDSDVASALGSGLKQLNREAAAIAFQKILFTFIQSPETVAQEGISLFKMLDYWGDLFDLDLDLEMFKATPAPGEQQQAPTEAAGSEAPIRQAELQPQQAPPV